MESLLIIAYISAIGVWGNLILQAVWFYWSYRINQRKHFPDSEGDIEEIDLTDKVEQFYKEAYTLNIDEHKREINWGEWYPKNDEMTSNPKPERDSSGKYNPDEIDGTLDTFFK